MTIDQCIQLAERECVCSPCEMPAECDIADCCLVEWIADEVEDDELT